VGDGEPFSNEPLRDFSDARQRDAFANAIGRSSVPAVANDGTIEQASAAVAEALAAQPAWRDRSARQRAEILIAAASEMRRRRDELSGVMIREAGKPWAEADADVCEAIDFCEYYARQSVGLFQP